jgi:hypothetical protein
MIGENMCDEKKHIISGIETIINNSLINKNLRPTEKRLTLDNVHVKEDKISTFFCKDCRTNYANKYTYNRHIISNYHFNKIKENKKNKFKFHCDYCNNGYMYSSSLSKHKKKCPKNPVNITQIVSSKEQQIQPQTIIGTLNNTTNNNTIVINNKINVNVYLNETCKNAINMSDFMEKIKPSFQEIEQSQRKGIVQSIADTFVDRLKELDTNNRPIHCSDKKRNTLYIKDNDNWNKDREHGKIHKIIDDISYKQFKTLQKWVQEMSKEFESEETSDKLIKITKEITTALGEDTYKKIIGKISKNIIIGT